MAITMFVSMLLLVLNKKCMKHILGLILIFFTLLIMNPTFSQKNNSFDWQGHRGARGLFPENSIYGFINALSYPVTTLELDIVVSKDKHIVVSHEPWFSEEISDGCKFENNLYKLNLSQIQSIDCGSKPHKRFPNQKKIITNKPTFKEVVKEVRTYCEKNKMKQVRFNIELKSKKEWEDVYIPNPALFVSLLLEEVRELEIEDQITLQSFDTRILEELHKKTSKIKLVLLAENTFGVSRNLKKISFLPYAYSPNYKYLKKCHVKKLHKLNVLVIPWTVNSKSKMLKMIAINVDGIITDYPNLIEEL